MSQIKRLTALFDEHVLGENRSSVVYRASGPNPYHSRTLNGLHLEFYYGTPDRLWTPWGEWIFADVSPSSIDLDGFMSRLTLRVHQAEVDSAIGVVGPIYAILAVDGVELPEPVLPGEREQRLDYEGTKAEWRRFYTE